MLTHINFLIVYLHQVPVVVVPQEPEVILPDGQVQKQPFIHSCKHWETPILFSIISRSRCRLSSPLSRRRLPWWLTRWHPIKTVPSAAWCNHSYIHANTWKHPNYFPLFPGPGAGCPAPYRGWGCLADWRGDTQSKQFHLMRDASIHTQIQTPANTQNNFHYFQGPGHVVQPPIEVGQRRCHNCNMPESLLKYPRTLYYHIQD